MMKAKARFFKGIEFIQVSELPADQQLLLQSSPAMPERIKILVDGKILENCIQYSHYSNWLQQVFEHSIAMDSKIPSQNSITLATEVAISKS